MNIPYGTARPPSYDNNYNDKHKKYTVSQKKRPTLSFAVTLTNIDGFSKFFYWYIVWKICNNTVIKYATTPSLCRYTTLWNVNVRKTNNNCMQSVLARLFGHLQKFQTQIAVNDPYDTKMC